MSFEGYYQYLCAKGHYFECDLHNIEPKECIWELCNEPIAWRNLVDTTNGTWCLLVDDEGWLARCDGCEYCDNGRIDGFVVLRELTQKETVLCPTCRSKSLVQPATYEIPEKGDPIW